LPHILRSALVIGLATASCPIAWPGDQSSQDPGQITQQKDIAPHASVDQALRQIAGNFGWLDWGVIVAYLAFTTVLGALLAGRQASIRDYFLAGRRMPWLAVWGSIIATEMSAASFLILPSLAFRPGGNLTYLQLAIGMIVARIIIGYFFVPAFYEREIYSPYDYMGSRLGERARKMATALFTAGVILAQGARIYISAVALQVITGTDIVMSIVLIGAVSTLWTWIGGIRTVIWTDVIQFVLFTVAAFAALTMVCFSVEGGLLQILRQGYAAGKLRVLNTALDNKQALTLWCGLLATPWLTLASHGTDQMNAQRMFTCRGAPEARKAIVWSSASMLITAVLLFVGAALHVFYQEHPLSAAESAVVNADANRIFAVFIVDALPRGISGLVMAGILAAGISTVESALAALAQATQSTVFKWLRKRPTTPRQDVLISRLFVLFWGVALTAFALFCGTVQRHYADLIQFAIAMTTYTYGGLLGMFLLALLPTRRNDLGLVWGVPFSVLAVIALSWHSEATQIIVAVAVVALVAFAFYLLRGKPLKIACICFFAAAILVAQLVAVGHDGSGTAIYFELRAAWPWLFPIGTAITFIVGYVVGERKEVG